MGRGLDSLNNFSGLWVLGVVPSYPVPGPGVFSAEGYCFLEHKSQREKVVWSVGSGLIDLHMEGMFAGKLFAVSRN